jgi:hypothetical protein
VEDVLASVLESVRDDNVHDIEAFNAPTASIRSGGDGVGSIGVKSAPAGSDNSGCDRGGACRDNAAKNQPEIPPLILPEKSATFRDHAPFRLDHFSTNQHLNRNE